MKIGSIKTALTNVVSCLVTLFFVVLLTTVFSFLGTILCALLVGMMMGAIRPSKWLSVPMSFLFPLVIFGVFRFWRTELPEGRMVLVSLVCFGGFWGIYGLAAALTSFEQNGPADAMPGTQSVLADAGEQPPGPATLSLDELRGTWLSQGTDEEGHTQRKEMEIREGELVLKVIEEGGRPGLVARGELRLERTLGAQRLVIAAPGKSPG